MRDILHWWRVAETLVIGGIDHGGGYQVVMAYYRPGEIHRDSKA